MKPISDLSEADLELSPIWEWATSAEGEGDETYVSPISIVTVPTDGEYHVALRLITADGNSVAGLGTFCDGQLDADGVGAVAASGGYWPLDCPPHGRREIAAFQGRFGMSFEAFFPVSWAACTLFHGERDLRSGVVAAPAES